MTATIEKTKAKDEGDLTNLDFWAPISDENPKLDKFKVIRKASSYLRAGQWVARRINAVYGEPNRFFDGVFIEKTRAEIMAERIVSTERKFPTFSLRY